jgi:leucyl aminopeptidase
MALKLNLALPHPAEADVDTLVLGVFEDAGLSAPAKAVDERCEGQLSAWLTAGDVSGKLGRTALLRGLNGARASRVLCLGLGEASKFDAGRYQKAVSDAIKALSGSPARQVLLTLSALEIHGRDTAWAVRQGAIAVEHASYRYTATKKSNADGARARQSAAEHLHAGLSGRDRARHRRQPRQGQRRDSRARTDAGAGHGLAAGVAARLGQSAAPDRAEVRRRRGQTPPTCWSARASPSTPAAST